MRIIKPVEFDPSEGSFARASTGTYFDKDGVLRTAAVDEPRWNYTFEDGEWVGPELLVEDQSTNLLTHSSDFANAAWGLPSPAITINADSAIAPDGTLTAYRIEKIAEGYRYISQAFVTAKGTHVASCFVKAGSNKNFTILLSGDGANTLHSRVGFNLETGTWSDYSSVSLIGAGVIKRSDGWLRIWVASNLTTNTNPRVFFYPDVYSAANAGYVLIWGAQLEAGDRPTSYIKTLGTPVTRAADLPGRIVSNVPENDAPVWEAGTYTQGTKRIQNHRVYEVLAESTADSPAEGAAKAVPTWLNLGATNRWRMFDDKVGSLTEQAGSIAVTLTPGSPINSLALFNLLGRDATVTLTDPLEGVVYERTISLIDAGVDNWYDWFFAPIGRRSDVVLLDLPAYGAATLSITIDNTTETAACGHCVIGQQVDIGVALYGTSVGIADYSRKETDAFGNAVVIQRAFSKRAEFDVVVQTGDVSAIQRLLASVRAQPVVWIGADGYESTVLFGYYRDFSISISGPSVSDATITVEGLT